MWWSKFSSREITINALKDKQFDGGYSSLTAVYGGISVAVVERRRVGGGAVTTEEELKLERHGMKLDPASASFTPILDEGYLLLGELDRTEISKFCFCDTVAYLRYKSQLESFYKLLASIRDSPTPEISEAASSFGDKLKNKLNEPTRWSACLQHAVSLGQKEMGDVMDLLLSPASKVPNNWFEVCRRGDGFYLLSPSRLSSMMQRKLELT